MRWSCLTGHSCRTTGKPIRVTAERSSFRIATAKRHVLKPLHGMRSEVEGEVETTVLFHTGKERVIAVQVQTPAVIVRPALIRTARAVAAGIMAHRQFS